MNIFRCEAMVEEFPFLAEIFAALELDHEDITSIRVQRIDEHFLRRVLIDHYFDGSAGCSLDRETLWAIMPDGEVVKVDVTQDHTWGSNCSHDQPSESPGEPILGALVGLEEATHLVLYERELDDWPGRDYVNERRFTVFKSSRSTSIAEEIERAREAARREVRNEADF